jgi:hypothetical protein
MKLTSLVVAALVWVGSAHAAVFTLYGQDSGTAYAVTVDDALVDMSIDDLAGSACIDLDGLSAYLGTCSDGARLERLASFGVGFDFDFVSIFRSGETYLAPAEFGGSPLTVSQLLILDFADGAAMAGRTLAEAFAAGIMLISTIDALDGRTASQFDLSGVPGGFFFQEQLLLTPPGEIPLPAAAALFLPALLALGWVRRRRLPA